VHAFFAYSFNFRALFRSIIAVNSFSCKFLSLVQEALTIKKPVRGFHFLDIVNDEK